MSFSYNQPLTLFTTIKISSIPWNCTINEYSFYELLGVFTYNSQQPFIYKYDTGHKCYMVDQNQAKHVNLKIANNTSGALTIKK